MISGEQSALMNIVHLAQETEHDVEQRIMRIDKNLVMRPVTYKEEMERKLKNSISWCQRHIREARSSIDYFKTQADGAEFISSFEEEIEDLKEQIIVYKAALSQVREA